MPLAVAAGLLPLLRSYAASVTANSRSRVGGSFINIMFGLSLLIFVLPPSPQTPHKSRRIRPSFLLSLSSLRDIRYGHRRRSRDRKQRRRHGGGARGCGLVISCVDEERYKLFEEIHYDSS